MVKSTNVLDVLKLFSSWVLVKTPVTTCKIITDLIEFLSSWKEKVARRQMMICGRNFKKGSPIK